MKITKAHLKKLIIEALEDLEKEDPTKLRSQSMAASQFGAAGREQRLGANPELSNLERGIIDQVSQFLLDLASLPKVDLSVQTTVIQRVMKVLQNSIAKQADQPEQGDNNNGNSL